MNEPRERDSALNEVERIAFGDFVLECKSMRLLRARKHRAREEQIHLTPQSLQLLMLLLESDGRLVSRFEVQEVLWPDRTVDFEQGLGHCVRKLRASLGDDAKNPTYIETVPRLGFRFLQPLEEVTVAGGEREVGIGMRPAALAAVAATVVVLAVVAASWPGRGAPEPDHKNASFGGEPDAADAILPLRVEVLPSKNPELVSQAAVFADQIPRALADALGYGPEGTLRVGFEPDSAPARLAASLQVPGKPRVDIDVVPPASFTSHEVARDLAREFARILRADDQSPGVKEREELITIERFGETGR